MCMSVSHKLHLFLTPANKEENGKFWPCAEHFINLECNIDTMANHHRKYGHEEVLQQSWDNQTTCLKTETKKYFIYTESANIPSNLDKSQCKIFFINALHVLGSINTLLFECSAAIIKKRYPKHKAAQRLTIKVDRTDLMYLKKTERALFIYLFIFTCSKSKNLMWILIDFIFITPQIT